MLADWIEIKRGDIPAQHAGMHITLNAKGQIVMNRYTHRALGEPAAFSVLYDRANNRIGLRPAVKDTPNAYPALRSNQTGVMVRGHRLLREHRIILPHTVEFPSAEVDPDGILILDLRTARPSRRALGRKKILATNGHE